MRDIWLPWIYLTSKMCINFEPVFGCLQSSDKVATNQTIQLNCEAIILEPKPKVIVRES